MKILSLNRVELLIADRDMDDAVKTFNSALGFRLGAPHAIAEARLRSSVDFAMGLELVSPIDEESPIFPALRERGKGAILTIVWEVDSIEAAKTWAAQKGLPVRLYYEGEQDGHKVKQLCLHESAFFGYVVTLMEKVAKPPPSSPRKRGSRGHKLGASGSGFPLSRE